MSIKTKIKNLKVNKRIVAYVLAGTIALGYGAATNFNDHSEVITITDKERINKNDDSKYIVWGKDENGTVHTFENTDSLLRWKWNSSDVQGEIQEGKTYKLNLIGYRFGPFSKYENIISYEPVENEPAKKQMTK